MNQKNNEMWGEFKNLSTELLTRARLASYMGKSFGGDRELYEACGYPHTLRFKDLMAKFKRHEIAGRVITAPCRATWRGKPKVYDDDDALNITEFEENWGRIVKKYRVYHYLQRADILAGIGNYSVIVLGLRNSGDWNTPAVRSDGLLYLQVYPQEYAEIKTYDTNTRSLRYGMPEMYGIHFGNPDWKQGSDTETQPQDVHWTRVIHVPSDPVIDDDVLGIPRLEGIYNRLQDYETIMGASAEMYWRGGFPGFSFNLDPEADPDSETISDMDNELENYFHTFKRYLRVQGVEVKALEQMVSDPTPAAMMCLKSISGATGIPMRILIGSERGELSSKQDDENWEDRIDERREDHAEPIILRQFVDRLIELQVLPEPMYGETDPETGKKTYQVEWPDLASLSEKEQAEIGKIRAETLHAYFNTPNAEIFFPPEMFFEKLMNMEPHEIESMKEQLDRMMVEEEEDRQKEREARDAHLEREIKGIDDKSEREE